MRIVQILPYLYQGAARSVITLSVELKKMGHSITIVTSENPDGFYSHQPGMVNLVADNNIHIVYVDSVFKRDLELLIKSAEQVYQALGEADIVNAHSGASTFVACLYRDMFSVNTNVVSTVRGLGNSNKLDWHYLMDEYAFIRADSVIAISNYVASKLAAPLLNDKLNVIYNGIDLSRRFSLLNDQTEPQSGKFRLVAVGDLCHRKGYMSTLLAIEKCNDVELHIYGEGEEESCLVAKCCELNIQNRVFFHGYVDDISEVISKYNAFILTPVDEAFGLVFIEAMLAKLPIISSRVGAIPELIPQAYHDFLWDGADIGGLSDIISYVIENPSLAQNYAHNCYEHAVSNFSSSVNAIKTEEHYKSLLS